MTKGLVLLIGFALAGAAQAQIKCWTGADGRRACGDTPPPGARLETPRGAPAPQVPVPAATDRKKGTSASAAQEKELRMRQVESQRAAAARAAAEKVPDSVIVQRCEQARESLRQMKGGGRSKRTDAVRARKLEAENC